MLSPKRALILALSSLLLMGGCASTPAPCVSVAQTQVRVPPPPAALVKLASEAPDFVKWLEEIYSSSMGRLGLSQSGTQPPPTSTPPP